VSTTYRYRAATPDGRVVDGVLEAASPLAAIDALRQQTLVPVSVEPTTRDKPGGASVGWLTPGRRDDALAAATRTIATLLAGGATLDRALRFAAEHAGTPALSEALQGVRADVQRGATLASALHERQATFGAFAAAIVRSGEEGGSLDEALSLLADQVERSRELRAQLRTALWYPALLGTVAGLGVIVLLAIVVPRFVSMLGVTGGTLPTSTRLLVLLSALVTQGWWILLLAFGLIVVGARAWLEAPGHRERLHRARLRWPVTGGLERTIAAARYCRSFGLLLQGGSGVLSAMRVARQGVQNLSLGSALDSAAIAVERGEGVAHSLDAALPPLATQLLAVGEESGTLDAMALRVADTFDAEAQRALRSLVGLVEPLLIVVFGGVVGFVALAMLQAMYSINATVL